MEASKTACCSPGAGPAGPAAPSPAPFRQTASRLAGWPCRFIVEPDIDPALLPLAPAAVRRFAGGETLAADDWLSGCEREGETPAVFVTRVRLRTAQCASVFGFADRRARAAVISLAGLEADDPVLLRRRLAALAAHELGHLAGHAHCPRPGCLMRPAGKPEDLDSRRLDLCPSCRLRRAWPAAALLALCLAASLLLDAAIDRIRNRAQVFGWSAAGGAAVLFQGEEILRLKDPAAARSAAGALNALYAAMAPPPLELERRGRTLSIRAGGRQVAAMDAVETGGRTPEEFARSWIARIDPVIQGKGAPEQGCPSCHVGRRPEVLDSMARRARRWR